MTSDDDEEEEVKEPQLPDYLHKEEYAKFNDYMKQFKDAFYDAEELKDKLENTAGGLASTLNPLVDINAAIKSTFEQPSKAQTDFNDLMRGFAISSTDAPGIKKIKMDHLLKLVEKRLNAKFEDTKSAAMALNQFDSHMNIKM